jgi:hypothetical protein
LSVGVLGVDTLRYIGLLLLLILLTVCPLVADSVLLGDISYQIDDPISGINSVVLDNFTDLVDLGCSTTFPICDGLDISGTLSVTYLDSLGNTQSTVVTVGSTGPGSTPVFEFDPSLITFESAVLSGAISLTSFTLDDGSTFISTGIFTSDTLTPDVGFGVISVEGNEANAVPEPAHAGLAVAGFMTFGAILLRRRLAVFT